VPSIAYSALCGFGSSEDERADSSLALRALSSGHVGVLLCPLKQQARPRDALRPRCQIGRSAMSHRTKIVLITACLLSALNAVALVLNLSQPSMAAVRGMSYHDLLRDPDFTRAVKTIAEQCSVNVDLAKLKCQEG
jgi:hypothetical protein